MGFVQAVNSDGYRKALEQSKAQGKLLVVDFYAVWCGPCKMIAPILETLASVHQDVMFIKIEEKEGREVMQEVGISAFPTFHFYLEGVKVHELRGANQQAITQAIIQYKAQAKPKTPFTGAGKSLGGSAGSIDDVRAARLSKLGSANLPSTTAPTSTPSLTPSHTTPSILQPNAQLLHVLVNEMGFSAARAEAALIHTNNQDLESAIDWLSSHDGTDDEVQVLPSAPSTAAAASTTSEEDAAIAVAQADADALAEASHQPKKKLTEAEVQALLVRRRAEKAEEAKVRERELEIKRREEGKKTSEMAEELAAIQRKREIEKIKAEQAASIKERQRIRIELLKDKLEKTSDPVLQDSLMKQIQALVNPVAATAESTSVVTAESSMEASLTAISAFKMNDVGKTSAQTLRVLCLNALEKGRPSPNDAAAQEASTKYRSINLDNPKIKERIVGVTGALGFLRAAGWSKDDATSSFRVTDDAWNEDLLKLAVASIDKAFASHLF
jgi:thioredoxin